MEKPVTSDPATSAVAHPGRPSTAALRHMTISSFDGHAITVAHAPLLPQRPYVVIALPFGSRPSVAQRLCSRLSTRFNVLTWQTRSIVDEAAGDMEEIILTPDMHADDLAHLLRYFGVGTCDVIGFCSGAGIALLAAARHPSRINRMVLVCGEYMVPPRLCPRTSFQRDVDCLLPLAAVDRPTAALLWEKIAAAPDPADLDLDEDVALPFSTPEYLYRHGVNYVGYSRVDFLTVATSVTQRALLISTADDRQVSSRTSELIAERLPNNRGHVLVAGDHYELLRGGAGIVGKLLTFLGEERR